MLGNCKVLKKHCIDHSRMVPQPDCGPENMLEARTYLYLGTASVLTRHLFKFKPIQRSLDAGSGIVRGFALMKTGNIVAKKVASFMAMRGLNWRFYTTVCPRCGGNNTLYTVFLNIRSNSI
jgi:hypothetical protein